MSMFNFPECRTVYYVLNPETGKYQKQPERIPFNKLPFELKVETTRDEKIKANGATEIITSGFKNGKRQFFTGLLPVYNSNTVFYGNDYQSGPQGKKNSLVIFRFSPDNTRLCIHYFNNYYKQNPEQRLQFVTNYVKNKENL